MRDWRVDLFDGTVTVEADTEEAARQAAIRQITTAKIRVWDGWTVIDVPSGSIAVKAENEETARQQAISQIKTATIRVLKCWTVDLGSLSVAAVDGYEAFEEAMKQIKEGDIEIDQIFEEESAFDDEDSENVGP
jgi:uncharacterized protein YdcH (DUF465 family)